MMKAVVFTTLLLLAATASAVLTEADRASVWNVDFSGSCYDAESHTTTFTYTATVTCNSIDEPIHYLVLEAAEDCVSDPLASGQSWHHHTDSATGVTGYKYPTPQACETTVSYEIEFKGKVGLGSGSIGIVGSDVYDVNQITIGSCAPVNSQYHEYIDGVDTPTDSGLTCADASSYVAPAELPVGWSLVSSEDVHVAGACDDSTTKKLVYSKTTSSAMTTKVTFTLSFKDEEKPTFHTGPAVDLTVPCDHFNETLIDEIPTLYKNKTRQECEDQNLFCVFDNCDDDVHIHYCDERMESVCGPEFFVTRTWTVTDKCGNSLCHTQTIAVEDNIAPAFNDTFNDYEIDCPISATDLAGLEDNEARARSVVATDACVDADFIKPTFNEDIIPNGCNNTLIIHRTWSVTDDCDNEQTMEQLITISDNDAPVFSHEQEPNDNIIVYCPDDGANYTVSAFDACADAEYPVSVEEISSTPVDENDECQDRYIVREYSTCDDCGNKDTMRLTFTVKDILHPVFDATDLNILKYANNSEHFLNCDEDVPSFSLPVDDECEGRSWIVPTNDTKYDDPTCETIYSVVRTWTATDKCGNYDTYTVTWHIEDKYFPQFNKTYEDTTVNCTDVEDFLLSIEGTVGLLADPCGEDVKVIGPTVSEPLNSVCDHTYDLHIKWDAEDCAGNPNTTDFILHVVDDAFPTIETPVDVNISCEAGLVLPSDPVAASDNCDTSLTLATEVLPAERLNPGSCASNAVYKRTFTATDQCSHTTTTSQIVRFYDNTAPEWDYFPDPEEISCENDFRSIKTPTGKDACEEFEVVAHFDKTADIPGEIVEIDDGCEHHFEIHRKWQLVDACGNKSGNLTQIITVVDKHFPTLSGTEGNITVPCDAIPCPVEVTATDLCTGLDITFDELVTPDASNCDAVSVIRRTWVADDRCGHSKEHVQYITVEDTGAPVYEGESLENSTLECYAGIERELPWTIITSANFSDNCAEVTVTYKDSDECDADSSCACGKTYTRTWTAVDECGNPTVLVQVIRVQDTKKPDFKFPIENGTTTCADIDNVVWATIAGEDDCSNIVIPHSEPLEDIEGACPNEYTMLMNHTITDNCGRTRWEVQAFTVTDEADPIFRDCPADFNITCIEDLPAQEDLNAYDLDCEGNEVSVTVTQLTPDYEYLDDSECASRQKIVRKWEAKDACQRTKLCKQTIFVNDVVAPVIDDSAFPTGDDLKAQCKHPKPAKACVSDNCKELSVDLELTRSDYECTNYDMLYTYTAHDNCGEPATASYTVEVRDTEAPVFDNVDPSLNNTNITCGEIASFTPPKSNVVITATDACGTATVTDSTEAVPTGCGDEVDLVTTYVAKDGCGNNATLVIVTFARDQEDPVYVWGQDGSEPADIIYTPQEWKDRKCVLPARRTATGTDDCGEATVTPGQPQTVNGETCDLEKVVTYPYSIVDECENSVPFSYNVSAPLPLELDILNPPADLNLSCNAPLPIAPLFQAVTGCGLTIDSVDPVDRDETPRCDGERVVNRTWTFTDECLREKTHTQIVTFQDISGPTGTAQGPFTLNNKCSVQTPVDPNTDDVCGATVTVGQGTYEKVNEQTCPYEFDLEWTWPLTDDCSNTGSVEKTYTYTFDALPKFYLEGGNITDLINVQTDLESQTFECDCIPDVPSVKAERICGEEIAVTFTNSTKDHQCDGTYTLVWTFTAVDTACSNLEDVFEIELEIVDTHKPEITFSVDVADKTVECGFEPEPPVATAVDNCGGVDVDFVEYRTDYDVEDCCDYKIVRVWTAQDDCNEPRVVRQVITVIDTIPPVLNGVPADGELPCPERANIDDLPIHAGEAPLAQGWCIVDDASVAVSAECQPSPAANSISIGGISGGFETVSPVAFVIEWVPRLNGSIPGIVFVQGEATDGSSTFFVNLEFETLASRAVAVPAAIRDFNANCYADSGEPSGPNPNNFNYYSTLRGNITASDGSVLASLSLAAGTFAQLGRGAGGRSLGAIGLAASVTDGTNTGDIRIQLTDCTVPGDHPELECEDRASWNYTTTVILDKCDNNTGVIHYDFWANDTSGNLVEKRYTTTIVDTTRPTWDTVNPATVSQECTAPGYFTPEASDECSETDVNGPFVNDSNVICAHKQTFKRVWNATDACGNIIHQIQKVTVTDAEGPSANYSGSTHNVQCVVPAAPIVVWTDNCLSDVVVLLTGDEVTSNADPTYPTCKYTLTRTWDAEDVCGNQAAISPEQVINVNDDQYPVLDEQPSSNHNLVCDSTSYTFPAVAAPTFTDVCTGDYTGSPSDPDTTASTRCAKKQKLAWNIADSCGNSAPEVVAFFTANDEGTPTLSFPANFEKVVRLSCSDNVPARPTPTPTDECQTLTAADVQDHGDVVFTDATVAQCKAVLADHPEVGLCDELACSSDSLVVRKWTVDDGCSHSADYFQFLLTVDTEEPVIDFSEVIPSIVINCTDPIPCPPKVSASDDCNDITLDFVEEDVTNDPRLTCVNDRMLRRTWTATDNCGKDDEEVQEILIFDKDFPEWTSKTDVILIPCQNLTHDANWNTNAGEPNWINFLPLAVDPCEGAVSTNYIKTENVGTACSVNFTVSFSASDACGHTIYHDTVVRVYDDESATCSNCDAPELESVVRECGVDVIPGSIMNYVEGILPVWPSTHDNCQEVSGSNEGDYEKECLCDEDEADCKVKNQVWTWDFNDGCNAPTQFTFSFNITDNRRPIIDEDDLTDNIDCSDTVPAVRNPLTHDECHGSDVQIDKLWDHVNSPDGELSSTACASEYTLNRTFSVTDPCGHVSYWTHLVHVTDGTAATLTPPADQTFVYDCDASWPAPLALSTSDNCNEDNLEVEPVVEDPNYVGDCPNDKRATRKYWVKDCVHNEDSWTQEMFITDKIDPFFPESERDTEETVSCELRDTYTPPTKNPDDEAVGDSCTASVTSVIPNSDNAACNETVVYTYTATDSCSKTVTTTHTVHFVDTIDPVIEAPPGPASYQCSAPDQVELTCTDSCNGGVVFDAVKGVPELVSTNDCGSEATWNRTWTCTDSCGNTDVAYQIVTITNKKPYFETFIPLEPMQCTDVSPPQKPLAFDGCTHAAIAAVDVVLDSRTPSGLSDTCKYDFDVTYDWTATFCSETETTQTSADVDDTVDPEFTTTFTDEELNPTYECDAIPCPPTVSGSDNCAGLDATFKEEVKDKDCEGRYTLVRTWTLTDACGASAEPIVQTINVTDFGGLSWELPEEDLPQSYSINCVNVSLIEDAPTLYAVDSCETEKIEAEFSDEVINQECEDTYTIQRTWTAYDDCLNELVWVQNISVYDNQNPTSEDTNAVCLTPVLHDIDFGLENITNNGKWFTFADECSDISNVTLTVLSCTSNQDGIFGTTDLGNGFTSDCYLDGTTLQVRARAAINEPNGRLYTVVMTGTDDCENSATEDLYIWVPRDENSDSSVFPEVSGVGNCVPAVPPSYCNANCPCGYGIENCEEINGGDAQLVFEGASVNSAGNGPTTTTFRYKLDVLSGPFDVVKRVQIGLDLAKINLEKFQPEDAKFGFSENSFLSGIIWESVFQHGDTFNVTVIGDYSSTGRGNVNYQLAGDDHESNSKCSSFARVTGPVQTNTVCTHTIGGTVGVGGTLHGNSEALTDAPRCGLDQILIELRNKTTGAIVEVAFTNCDGEYSFCADDSTEYTVNINRGGILSLAAQVHNRIRDFLSGINNDAAGMFPYGIPRDASHGNHNHLHLRFNNLFFTEVTEDLAGSYLGSTAHQSGLIGTGRNIPFWKHQLNLQGSTVISNDDVTVYAELAASFIPACMSGGDERLEFIALLSGSPDIAEVAAVALNHAAGYGLLEPYRETQSFVLKYANSQICGTPGPDAVAAQDLIQEILYEAQ